VAERAQAVDRAHPQERRQDRPGQPEDDQDGGHVGDQQVLGHVGRERRAGEVEHRRADREREHRQAGPEGRDPPARHRAPAPRQRPRPHPVRDRVGGEQRGGEHRDDYDL
jgi:hypothetical protein